MAELVNVSATERLPKGAVLRVTLRAGLFGKIRAALTGLDLFKFSSSVTALWTRLASTKFMYPISPNPALKDSDVAVMDVRLVNAMVYSDFERVFQSQITFSDVVLARVEYLTRDQAATAASNAGARQREVLKAEEAKKSGLAAGLENALGLDKLASFFGTTAKVVRWAVLLAVLAVLAYLVANARGLLRDAKGGA